MKSIYGFLKVYTLILILSFVWGILHNEMINENTEIIPDTNNQVPETPSQDKIQSNENSDQLLQSSTIASATEPSVPSDAKTQASIVQNVIVNKAEMLSFEEWKEMKLKDETQNKVNIPISSKPVHDSKDQKIEILQRRKNYASLHCGAKLIANNKESSNPSHILTESKDDYMLNSCSSKVWFIIELCEAIKLNEIQIANFELFSNVPRQFKIYASERFIPSSNNNWPSKYFLGTFEANNTRNLQTFTLKDSLESKLETSDLKEKSDVVYVKYVKFEMLSHYGNEHYCPLSVVRIFGTSLNDDEEGAVEDLPLNLEVNENLKKEYKILDDTLTTTTNNKEKPKFFQLSSIFLTNIISAFLGEKFKFPNFFSKNSNSNLSEPPSETINLLPENDTHTPVSLNLIDRKLVLNTDMHRILCFTSSVSLRHCCQCPNEASQNEINNQLNENSSFNFYSSSQYCSYYYLMITSAQARSNSSLLTKYLEHIKPFQEQNLTNNFTQFSLNNIQYYILNEWLDNQTLSSRPMSNKLESLNDDSNILVKTNETLESVKDKLEPESIDIKKKETDKEAQIEIETKSEIINKTESVPEVASETIINLEDSETGTQSSSTLVTPTITPASISNEKNALFARLTNRIKMLELNMSLSSQYLEKLSVHYRKQMDEMQKAFNLTTSALIDTIRVADERDIKQNEKIILIEKKIDKIEKSLVEVDIFLNEVKLQTYALKWTAIIVLFSVIFIEMTRCCRRKGHSIEKKIIEKNEPLNLDVLIEQKCKELLEKQEENFRKRLEFIEEFYKSNQIKCENLESSAIKEVGSHNITTRLSSTIAVVAAIISKNDET
ncbi:unnamed protein product [Brachionus calyciflorus]|uniref:SUN domain-containing protein n=1 Tax=Brachionus calyciflorus TaxID=104777 RepID=A0A813VGX2_9BILA|nr:unnamed protein product [Brachionus calyciflorus]